MAENTENLDNVIAFLVIKKLVTPIEKTDAYSLGLVDKQGKILRNPETDEEKYALTTLDKFMFKLKRLLGGKIMQLNNFLYLHTINSSLHRNLFVRGNVEQRSEIKRVKQGLDKLSEELEMPIDKILRLYSHSLIKEESAPPTINTTSIGGSNAQFANKIGNKLCSLCGKKLNKNYITKDKKFYHKDCL